MSFTSARWDVGIVAAATGLSFAGDTMAATTLTLTLAQRGASGLGIAALLLAATLPPVLLTPLAGRLVDRYPSRTLLIAVGAGQALVCAALALVTALPAVIALLASLAAGLAITGPTMSALVPQIVGPDRLARASANVQTARMLGVLAGSPLAGLLVGAVGPRLPLLLDAASYLAIVAAGLLLHTVRRARAHSGAASRSPGGWPLVRRDALLVGFLVLVTAGIAVVTAENVGSVFLIRGTLHSSTTGYGLLESLWTVAVIAGTWLLSRRTVGDLGLLWVTVVTLSVLGLTTLTTAGVPSVPWLVPVYVVGGLANGGLNLVGGVLLGRRVEPAARGRVGAVFNGVANAGTLVGFVTGGLLLEVVGPRVLYAVVGLGVLLVVAVLAGPVTRAGRRAVPAIAAGPLPAAGPVPVVDPLGGTVPAADPGGAAA